jgi:alginate O-acetyltransferase complex protein AlgI
MLFNSFEFAVFLPTVFILYWFVINKNVQIQNLLLIIVSYIFYGWWDWRFLSLIMISSYTDYTIGLLIRKNRNRFKKKRLLFISLFINLGILGVFKYFNFFINSFISAFVKLGIQINPMTISIILPVGISFYTFQTLSYTIDIYKKRIEPTEDLIAFFAFVSFFPQLVAGPIERAQNLLPQFFTKRSFDYDKAKDGMRQILWGLFKKIVIADSIAIYVNYIFDNSINLSGYILLLGGTLFAFQIYGDFSGYSDIAIGAAKLFGFNLKRNFAFPYFSRDIAEFWRRWHISLTTWFRDYLYIPLGGSRGSIWIKLRNTLIVFVTCGFWHGAKFTFIAWGLINALYFLPLLLLGKNRQHLNTIAINGILPSLREIFQVVTTFFLTVIAWIFFRAESIEHALMYIKNMFSSIWQQRAFNSLSVYIKKNEGIETICLLIVALIVTEWIQRRKSHGLEDIKIPVLFRWPIYLTITFFITYYINIDNPSEFVYFQF